jgi:ParB/RepB/Spo0J family partition protein
VNEFKTIPLTAIYHSPYNPRRKPTADDPKVKELAASIKAVGLIQPISLRHTGVKGDFEIIAGARRFEAAKLAGLKEIAAMVHQISEDDALKITVTENLQRQDLTPLEEGRGIASLLEAGRSTDEIAADIAKSPTWVRRRAKLVKLSKDWQDAVTDGKLQYFSAAHLEVVAHLSPTIQKKLLTAVTNKHPDEGHSLSVLKGYIREYTHYLSEAIFTVSLCDGCQHRSDNEPDLFNGLIPSWEHDRKDKAQCLDNQCWADKVAAFLQVKEAAAIKKTGVEPIKVVSGYGKAPKGAVNQYRIKEVKAKDKGAVPAMMVDGPHAGNLIYIIPPKPETPRNQEKPKVATPKQLRLQHMFKAFEKWVDDQTQCPPSLLQSPYHMLAFVSTYGANDGDDEITPKQFDALTAAKSSVKLFDDLWEGAKGSLRIYSYNAADIGDHHEKGFELALHVCGLEMQQFMDEAEKAINPPLVETLTKTTKKGAKK